MVCFGMLLRAQFGLAINQFCMVAQVVEPELPEGRRLHPRVVRVLASLLIVLAADIFLTRGPLKSGGGILKLVYTKWPAGVYRPLRPSCWPP